MHGILYGVGVGPGDPRLMTFLAAETIKKCEVLAVPARTREQAVSYQIARGLLPELDQKACLSLAVPMTKDRKVLNAAYEQAADLVEEQLKAGKDVACLTLGDPTIYSTYLSSPYHKGQGLRNADHKRRSFLLRGQRPSRRQPRGSV